MYRTNGVLMCVRNINAYARYYRFIANIKEKTTLKRKRDRVAKLHANKSNRIGVFIFIERHFSFRRFSRRNELALILKRQRSRKSRNDRLPGRNR